MMRVGIIALLHESNTFIDQPTSLEHFSANQLVDGPVVVDAYRESHHEVGGFIESLSGQSDIETVGVFAARAMPFGTIAEQCWNALMQRLDESLASAGPLDGLLVAPHGATVAENAIDADGFWLARVRAAVGPKLPIIGTLDLHANVSLQMVNACQALIGYRTNPHLDQRARGIDAGNLMLKTLRGELSPTQALVQLPLCVNIERQATAEPHGVRLWNEADRLVREHRDVLSISCLYGFPYSDVPEMGASVVAVHNGDWRLAEQTAVKMAKHWWDMREEFIGQLISVENAIANANAHRKIDSHKPVGLLEMGDNVGGGGPGDGTWVAHGWRRFGSGRLLSVVCDPEAVSAASKAGVGLQLQLSVAGKLDPVRHGPPIMDKYRVVAITDGKFTEPEARHGGYSQFDQGTTAVLEGESGITLVVTTLRVAPMSLQQVLKQGIRIDDFAAIVIKGVHAPVAAYAPVCSQLIRVNTTGVTTADVQQLEYVHRRQPMVPFEHCDWTIA